NLLKSISFFGATASFGDPEVLTLGEFPSQRQPNPLLVVILTDIGIDFVEVDISFYSLCTEQVSSINCLAEFVPFEGFGQTSIHPSESIYLKLSFDKGA